MNWMESGSIRWIKDGLDGFRISGLDELKIGWMGEGWSVGWLIGLRVEQIDG